MEFPHVGKNCSWLPCKEIDFLPLVCSHCKSVFCKNHINADHHECTGLGEKKKDKIPTQTFNCTYDGCPSFSAVEMKCPCCQKNYCLSHRHHGCLEPSQEDLAAKKLILDASKQKFAQSLNEVNKIVNEGIKKSMQNPKKQEAAQKLNIMRLKAKCEGPQSIPTDNRIYFSIIYKKNVNSEMCKPIFTSKDWSVGRVIDSVSDICSVPNKNNVQNEKKLRLFKRSDGTQISAETSARIEDLINENKIINGETLILEYVNPNEELSTFRALNELEDWSTQSRMCQVNQK